MVGEAEQVQPNHWSAYRIRQGKKRAFLIAYLDSGSITYAAEKANVARCRHYEWLQEDPDYAAAFVDVQDRYVERLEREADRRAVDGVDKPIVYQGVVHGTYKEYSDNLLMFRLKALKPDKYRERISQENSGTVKVEATHRMRLDNLTDEELDALERISERIRGIHAQ